MGFGTLFFGYFLLLNIAYYTVTDLIAALIMAMGLYKLSSVNRHFEGGFYVSLAFAGIGLFELGVQLYSMFFPLSNEGIILSYAAIPRYAIIAVLTLFILNGIESVATEVELPALAKRAHISMPFALVIYGLSAVFEIPLSASGNLLKAFAVISTILLISAFVTVIINLRTIYSAYMRICMPEDKDNDVPDKPSKFGFVNKYREHSEQKQKEYAEYKLEKLKKKNSKKKK